MSGRHRDPESPSWTEQAFAAFDRWCEPRGRPISVEQESRAERGPRRTIGARALDDDTTVPTPRDGSETSTDSPLPKVSA